MNDIGKIAHVLKHSHGRCMVGDLGKILHEGSICTGHRSVLSFILKKSILIHFVHHGTIFDDKYITSEDRKKYIDHDGNGVFTKQNIRQPYNTEYQRTYSNRYYVLKKDYVKYTRNRWTYLEKKQRSIFFVYLKGPPYRNAEGPSQPRSFSHDEIINSATIIVKN